MSKENTNPKKVLVVDDDADVLTAISDSLNIYNIEHLLIQHGKDAIEQYQTNQQDIFLVLLDLKMPGMDGEAVYKALCEINPAISILITSGYHESEIMSKFIATGHVGFLPKPFTVNQLIKAIKVYLPT